MNIIDNLQKLIFSYGLKTCWKFSEYTLIYLLKCSLYFYLFIVFYFIVFLFTALSLTRG